MAKIIISRNTSLADKFRTYSVLLNNEVVGSIKNGGTFEKEIPKGTYTLRIKIDWCGSNSIDGKLVFIDDQNLA